MDWTEIIVTVASRDIDSAAAIAQVLVPGVYIEDYRNLEQEAYEVAGIDLIDEDLLKKDRTKCLIHLYLSPEENPTEATAFLTERFTAEKIGFELSTAVCRNEDWENNWKKYFKPIEVGERLLIQPIWEEKAAAGDRAVLNIEPGLAFGSGTHETTRLCLEALEPYIHSGVDMLDVGCGSGILSVASLLLGAERAVGVDIDALAVKTAQENGKLNGFTPPQYEVFRGSLTEKVSGQFDVIAANIVADIIILFSSQVGPFLKKDGVFIASGIIAPREAEVLEAFEKNGFEVIARHDKNDWLCFECKLKS
ncbi:MAG TPA: 50S ribosomal protein L11 methyltransferase [Ruminococcaceae bacterium]|nr:50S ribosomal protein L11 methyltransferase [Oscillospiraceae bacterium]